MTLGHDPGSRVSSPRHALDLSIVDTIAVPTTNANPLPRAERVQVAEGARRGGARRSTWTRPSTAAQCGGVGTPQTLRPP